MLLENMKLDVASTKRKMAWKLYWDLLGEDAPKKKPPFDRDMWPAPMKASTAPAPPLPPGCPLTQVFEILDKIGQDTTFRKQSQVTPDLVKGIKDIKALLKNQEVTFIEADKGAGLVLIDTKQLDEKIDSEILGDTASYMQLEEDPSEDLDMDLTLAMKSMEKRGLISREEAKAIQETSPRLPHLFTLIKLHKSGHPLRPVVSYVGSALSPSGHLLDEILKPVVMDDPRYLQDSRHILEIIEAKQMEYRAEEVDFKSLFAVSFDVVAFYPSVPHDLACKAVEEALKKTKLDLKHQLAVQELVKFHLEHAFFSHKDRFFKQISGLPIGSAIGGPVACLALAAEERNLEKKILEDHPNLLEMLQPSRSVPTYEGCEQGLVHREEVGQRSGSKNFQSAFIFAQFPMEV